MSISLDKDIIDIDNIIISKPHKFDNSYTCSIYYPIKKKKLKINFTNSILLYTKSINNKNEFFIFIKNKNFNNLMYDINDKIINIVKKESINWFNNNMNTNLVEDYYTNTIFYDKEYGDIIRLKCIGNEKILKNKFMKKNDINIIFNHLRFYKQKFVIECEIDSISEINNIKINDELNESDNSDNDLPYPDEEDISNIKEECILYINNYLEELTIQKNEIDNKITIFKDLQCTLEKSTDINTIITVCNKFNEIISEIF